MSRLSPTGDRRILLGYFFLAGMVFQYLLLFNDYLHGSIAWSQMSKLLLQLLGIYSAPLLIIIGGLGVAEPKPVLSRSQPIFFFALFFIVFWNIIIATPLLGFSFIRPVGVDELGAALDAWPKTLATVLDLVLAIFFTKAASD